MSELDVAQESEFTYPFKGYMAYPYYVNKNRPNRSSHLIVIHTIPKAEYACWRGNLLILFHPVLEIISCVEGRQRETQAPAASAACGILLNLALATRRL